MQLYFVIILALVAFTAADYTFPVYLDKEESYGYNARTYGKMLFNISSTETFDASFSQGSFIHRCVNTTHCVKHYDSSCLDSFEIIIFVVSNSDGNEIIISKESLGCTWIEINWLWLILILSLLITISCCCTVSCFCCCSQSSSEALNAAELIPLLPL